MLNGLKIKTVIILIVMLNIIILLIIVYLLIGIMQHIIDFLGNIQTTYSEHYHYYD